MGGLRGGGGLLSVMENIPHIFQKIYEYERCQRLVAKQKYENHGDKSFTRWGTSVTENIAHISRKYPLVSKNFSKIRRRTEVYKMGVINNRKHNVANKKDR